MTSEPKAPGAPAIILFREVDRDDRGLTAHEDVYFRIKILTEEGRKYADIEIPFFKEQGKIVNIHARTIKPDGTIVDFNGKAFDKSIVKARGVKYMAKTFTLPDVQVGSILEYYYTTDLSENIRLRLALDPQQRTVHQECEVLPEALHQRLPARQSFGGLGTSCRPELLNRRRPESRYHSGSEQYPRVSDRRLHAAGERIEVARRLHLQRRSFREGARQLLEETRQEAQ